MNELATKRQIKTGQSNKQTKFSIIYDKQSLSSDSF